ncbi:MULTISPECIES: hypothetical protein [Terrabacteria group]|uniref:hypothetical protein n=1 Tax=Bacillati TaxID=1783272 RepID=UPI00193A735C|nr:MULTISPECIES: hypothetical protein [Terrabacteria group]MBW9212804.1 hypothetical protein [Trueperella sp. zg.1013]QRG86634.1 hypothetical protein JOS54_07275 [Bulleidia sp. zg-1006]
MDWKLIVIFIILAIIFYLSYTFFSQRQAALLSILLYQSRDFDGYYKELETVSSKFFFTKKLRTLMRLDAILLEDNDQKIQEIIPIVDSFRLRSVERLIVTAKEFSYCVRRNKKEEAYRYIAVAKENFKYLSQSKKEQYQPLLDELEMTKSLVFEHSGHYAKELEKAAKSKRDGLTAGVFFLKAALANNYRKENEIALQCLSNAYERLKETIYAPQIKSIWDKKDWLALETLVKELS